MSGKGDGDGTAELWRESEDETEGSAGEEVEDFPGASRLGESMRLPSGDRRDVVVEPGDADDAHVSPRALSETSSAVSGGSGGAWHPKPYGGELLKWTNLVHGWHTRYFQLKRGVLSYFVGSEPDKKQCRATFNLQSAVVHVSRAHPTRFEIRIGATHLVLKAASPASRDAWIAALRHHMGEHEDEDDDGDGGGQGGSGVDARIVREGDRGSHGHVGSALLRMPSGTLKRVKTGDSGDVFAAPGAAAGAAGGGGVDGGGGDPLAKLSLVTELMRAIMQQSEELRRAVASVPGGEAKLGGAVDALGVSLGDAVEMVKALADQQVAAAKRSVAFETAVVHSRMEEGPDCVLDDEEFFECVEHSLACKDQEELEIQQRRTMTLHRLKRMTLDQRHAAQKRFRSRVDSAVEASLRLLDSGDTSSWTVVHKERGMVVSRTDFEVDGVLCDRSKTVCEFDGVSAKELAEYFFAVGCKRDWDISVETIDTLEELDKRTLVWHIVHKRVWPTAQRDSCMASHIRRLDDGRWVVVNESVNHDAAVGGKCVRVDGHIALVAQTEGGPTRDTIRTKVHYLASVNPGGWAPPAVVRAVSKREYPKVLRKLGQTCLESVFGKPVAT